MTHKSFLSVIPKNWTQLISQYFLFSLCIFHRTFPRGIGLYTHTHKFKCLYVHICHIPPHKFKILSAEVFPHFCCYWFSVHTQRTCMYVLLLERPVNAVQVAKYCKNVICRVCVVKSCFVASQGFTAILFLYLHFRLRHLYLIYFKNLSVFRACKIEERNIFVFNGIKIQIVWG